MAAVNVVRESIENSWYSTSMIIDMDLHKYLLSADGEEELLNAPLETSEEMIRLQNRFMELKEEKQKMKMKKTKKSESSIETSPSPAMPSMAVTRTTKEKGYQKRGNDHSPEELNSMLQEKKKKIRTISSACSDAVRSSATCTSRVSDDSTSDDSSILDCLDRLIQDEVDSKLAHVPRDSQSSRVKKCDPSDNDLFDISQIWTQVSSSMDSESDDILQMNACPLMLDGSEVEEGLNYWHSIEEENKVPSPINHICTKDMKRTCIESNGQQQGAERFLRSLDQHRSSPVSARSRTSESTPTSSPPTTATLCTPPPSPTPPTSPTTPTSSTTPTSPVTASILIRGERKR